MEEAVHFVHEPVKQNRASDVIIDDWLAARRGNTCRIDDTTIIFYWKEKSKIGGFLSRLSVLPVMPMLVVGGGACASCEWEWERREGE